jgi:circadian clock protein KaiB
MTGDSGPGAGPDQVAKERLVIQPRHHPEGVGGNGLPARSSKTTERYERLLEERREEHYVLQLYVTGMTPRSMEAIASIKRICEEHLSGRYELEVIDINQQPMRAGIGQVIAAPTLVKQLPLPLRRLIGNLANEERVLIGLDLRKA